MTEFIDFLDEVFEEFGDIAAKRMFGGFGIYHDSLMFAIVADDTLYLKADDTTKKKFELEGLPQFEYDRNGKTVKMSYYRAPEEIYDDREAAAEWAGLAYEAAVRSVTKKKRS